MRSRPRLSAPPPPSQDLWFATNGLVALGPVSLETVVRDVRQGRVHSNPAVRHSSWRVWLPLEELQSLDQDSLTSLVQKIGDPSTATGCSARQPPKERVLLPSEPPPRSTVRKAAINPVGVLGGACSYDEACLLALATAVTACSAQVGILWQWVSDEAQVACTLGWGTEQLLGERLPGAEPIVRAAHQNQTLLGEPTLGSLGQSVANRLAMGQAPPAFVAMVPVTRSGELVGFFELAQQVRPFAAREIGRVEDVAEVLLERILVQGWLEREPSTKVG